MYTIKQVAERVGISAYTLRFWDKEGLFPDLARDGKNGRLFSDQDLEWVMVVRCLRETGMPLSELKEYLRLFELGDATLLTRYQIIQNQVEKAEQERLAIERRIDTLKRKVEWYNGLIEQHEATGKRDSSLPA